jgi:transcriptional regulator with XRE-family HTH domain
MRAERDLSQERVEEAGDLSTPAIQRVESGRISVGFDILVGVADGLGVPLSELIAEYERQLQKLKR